MIGTSTPISTPTSTSTARFGIAIAALLFAALPGAGLPDDAAGLALASERLAASFDRVAPERGRVALAVSAAGAEGLADPVNTALSGDLARLGFAVLPLRRPEPSDAERAARALGADWLLRVRVSLVPGRRAVSLAGEALPVAPNFFLQRAPDVQPGGARLLIATAPADPVALALALGPRAAAPGRITLRPLWRIDGRVLALAVGDALGDGTTSVAVVTTGGVALYAATGQLLARRELGMANAQPAPAAAPLAVREPAATAAIAPFSGGRLAYRLAGAGAGEVLAASAGALRPVALLPGAPLCAGDAGPLFGAFAPGKGVLVNLLLRAPDPRAHPPSARDLFAVAAAPRGGAIAYGALGTDFVLALLGADLTPAAPLVPGVGAGFALADLDGDGVAEVVASSVVPGPEDRVRVLRASHGSVETVYASPPVPGALIAGAAGDLTGDGLDDAVLAAVAPGSAPAATQLYLVTADAREAP